MTDVYEGQIYDIGTVVDSLNTPDILQNLSLEFYSLDYRRLILRSSFNHFLHQIPNLTNTLMFLNCSRLIVTWQRLY